MSCVCDFQPCSCPSCARAGSVIFFCLWTAGRRTAMLIRRIRSPSSRCRSTGCRSMGSHSPPAKCIGFFFIVLLVNTAYVAAFATPSIFYMTNVLFHLGLGLALAIGLIVLLRKDSTLLNEAPSALGLFGISTLLALYIVKAGN